MTASEKIRVATVVTRFTAGAGGVALRGALALDPDRYATTIIAAEGGSLLDPAEEAGLEVLRLPYMRPEINPWQDWRALRELTELFARRQFDIVHTHSSKAGAIGRLAARRAGVPAIVHTFHGFPFNEFQSPARRATYVAIERRLGRLTDAFLAVGGGIAVEAIRLGIARPERTLVIASAIDPRITPATASNRLAARRLMGIPADKAVVGTVGRLDWQKAPDHMLLAFTQVSRPDTRFVWIGGGPMARDLVRQIRRRGFDGRFLLLGERDDVAALLPGLDLFAMSSRYEGLPCALVEAMTCGVPAVATAVNAVPDVVVNGRTGLLVPPGRPDLLAAAIDHLLARPEVAGQLAQAARQALGDRFSPQLLGQDLMHTYESVLASSPEWAGRTPLTRVVA